jgi:hypothetical protein
MPRVSEKPPPPGDREVRTGGSRKELESLTDSEDYKVDNAFSGTTFTSFFPATTDIGFDECITLYKTSVSRLEMLLNLSIRIELRRRAKKKCHKMPLLCYSSASSRNKQYE